MGQPILSKGHPFAVHWLFLLINCPFLKMTSKLIKDTVAYDLFWTFVCLHYKTRKRQLTMMHSVPQVIPMFADLCRRVPLDVSPFESVTSH